MTKTALIDRRRAWFARDVAYRYRVVHTLNPFSTVRLLINGGASVADILLEDRSIDDQAGVAS